MSVVLFFSCSYSYADDKIELLYPDEYAQDISEQVNSLANWVDSFFGQNRADDENKESTVRVTPSQIYYDGHPSEFSFGINLNLKLNNFESRARELENKILGKITPKNTSETVAEKNKKIKNTTLPAKNDWVYGLESNLTWKSSLFLSAKARARRNFESGIFIHHLAFEGGWDSDVYWTQKTSLFSDTKIYTALLFRFVNEATWYISSKDLQTTHGPSLIQTINEYNSVSYNFRKTYLMINNSSVLDNTSYNINFRHSTPNRKIFLDIIPDYSYPRSYNYAETRSITLRLEYVF